MTDIYQKTLSVLEWPKIVSKLSSLATSDLGRARIGELTFSKDLKSIRLALEQTSELKQIIFTHEDFPIHGLYDIASLLKKIGIGEILPGPDYVRISRTIAAGNRIKRYVTVKKQNYPRLFSLCEDIHDITSLEKKFRSILEDDGTIRDDASASLIDYRREVNQLIAKITLRLDKLLLEFHEKHLLQENYFTLRQDRYVFPFKAEVKHKIPGILHDSSITGQTIYLEPQELVNYNNELKMAKLRVEKEEMRILQELSAKIAEKQSEIEENIRILAELDLLYAKARFSGEINGQAPVLNDEGRVKLIRARHPTLILTSKHEVIPNDISLGNSFHVLVISGPNAGGKTVTLKTLGLFALMLKAGLHIPASPDSEMAIFDFIAADIGDEQSVEGNISTFSGHLFSIIEVFQHMTANSLILLDEIAVGTEPAHGAALAKAILAQLAARNARVVITTHYDDLKSLPFEEGNYENASMEFDLKALQPTYRLVIGQPGTSYAFEIARRLGIPADIVEQAEKNLNTSTLKLMEIISKLDRTRQEYLSQKQLFESERQKLDFELKKQQSLNSRLESEAKELLLKGRKKLEEHFDGIKRETNQIVTDMRKHGDVKTVKTAQANLSSLEKESIIKVVGKERLHVLVPEGMETVALVPEEITKGRQVLITTIGKTGEIDSVEPTRQQARVRIGMMTMSVDYKDIRGVKSAPAVKNEKKPKTPKEPPAPAVSEYAEPVVMPTRTNQCDLRGLTVDEAIAEAELFLDRAVMNRLECIFLIHGHGTGKLKDKLRKYLGSSHYVKSFTPGEQNQGGDGVTRVVLK
jgi:DNA mismatch repair protein MutS2